MFLIFSVLSLHLILGHLKQSLLFWTIFDINVKGQLVRISMANVFKVNYVCHKKYSLVGKFYATTIML